MNRQNRSIGFMQGRLCEPVEGKIQAFPWRDWESEFSAAAKIELHLMEWTLDHDRLYENPLMTMVGQEKIRKLCLHFGLSIPSLTGDCFMQRPFWKVDGQMRLDLQEDFLSIGRACAAVGIRMLVVPLVDNGRLETKEQEKILLDFLFANQSFLTEQKLQVIFESDFPPPELARFISQLPVQRFGINYDIGNSAALGFKPEEEFLAYGDRVVNVHVKDRLKGGNTVALKDGSADFDSVFYSLAQYQYRGNFILQTARSQQGSHSELLCKYRGMTHMWMEKYGLA